jgi:hypothetical protein
VQGKKKELKAAQEAELRTLKELGNFKEATNLLEEEHDPDLLF